MPRATLGHPNGFTTDVSFPDGITVAEAVRNVTDTAAAGSGDGIWAVHGTAPAPEWVASEDVAIADAIAAVYGCSTRPFEEG